MYLLVIYIGTVYFMLRFNIYFPSSECFWNTILNPIYSLGSDQVKLETILELVIFIDYEGQLKQESLFEGRIHQDLVEILKSARVNETERVLMWAGLY